MPDLTGKKLGRYEIVEEIGHGGMAIVYKAYQPSLHRSVALKVLPDNFARDHDFVARFQREAIIAASLEHPNIVTIHEVGEEGGVPFIVMKLLRGRTLKQVIQEEGRLNPLRVAKILDQIASALDYAHSQGVVHRDIKPSNIVLDDRGHLTLTDFGIAKALGAEKITQTGMTLGTAEYLSPEAAEGMAVDGRSDIYSLGVLLFEMLTGRVPFPADTPYRVVLAHMTEPPPSPRTLVPDLPMEVEEVVLKALAKKPQDRFPTAGEMAQAYHRALAGRSAPVETAAMPAVAPAAEEAPSAAPEPALPRRGTSPLLWAAATLAGLLAVGVMGLALALGPTAVRGLFRARPTATRALPRQTETPRPEATSVPRDTPLVPATVVPLPTRPLMGTPGLGGRVLYQTEESGRLQIHLLNLASGERLDLSSPKRVDFAAVEAPDGKRIALVSAPSGQASGLFVMNLDGSGLLRLTDRAKSPAWSPDSSRLAFMRDGKIYAMKATGGEAKLVSGRLENCDSPTWGPGGTRIAFESGRVGGRAIWVVGFEGAGPEKITAGEDETNPAWSHQGDRIAFQSKNNIYLTGPSGGDVTLAVKGGVFPIWSPEGKALAFVRGEELWAWVPGPDREVRVAVLGPRAVVTSWGR
ncbi:MAG: protein kinase [Chloroflexota bacterium]